MSAHLYIITGTTKGLGAALVSQLAAQLDGDSASVVIGLSRFARNDVAKTENGQGEMPIQSGVWGKNGANANIYADFTDVASLGAVCRQIEAHLGSRQFQSAFLLNNAGVVMPVERFDALEAASLSSHLHVNVVAPMALSAWFATFTRTRATSRMVINISSGAAKRAIAGWSAYCAAKAALEMATRVAALEAHADDPTLVLCSLAPGVVDTPMQASIRVKSASAFPDVERFRAMKADGTLRPADAVAREIIQHLQTPAFEQLARQEINLDIRNLHAKIN